ncbi:MAG: hypothetical protein NVS1B10_05800 [Candidatus Saccharimonadales bacterium]
MSSFVASLKKGSDGESRLLRMWPELKRLDGKRGDFIAPDGRKLELKSESRNVEDTPNFFIERYSNFEKKSPGGPWQSLEQGSELMCFTFRACPIGFLFDVKTLVLFIEPILSKLKPIFINNKGYKTMGYAVPREALMPICTQLTFQVKTCCDCKQEKSVEEFHKRTGRLDGRHSHCTECAAQRFQERYAENKEQIKEFARKRNKANPEKVRDAWLRSAYGITAEDYQNMLMSQGGTCGICGGNETSFNKLGLRKPLAVDHCHTTNIVRGLLCTRCNMAIGLMHDNPDIAEAALLYLNQNNRRLA